ncbi:MAG: VanZ family protein, partial [Eubacterium sp.]|nr:VanZ family protein [Eubacterium sp.]
EYAASIDHPVRKAAHFSEYMLLGILLFGAWYDSDRKKSKNFLVPFIIGSLYAASDELHQLLISGRAGMFSEVLIDSSGVFAGVLLSMLSVILFVLFKSKRQKAHK